MGRLTNVGIAFALSAAACTSTSPPSAMDPAEPSGTLTPTTFPTPAVEQRPEKPRPSQGRLDGTYLVRFTPIQSNVGPTDDFDPTVEWTFNAKCRTGGACNARIESENGWKALSTWRRSGSYRWSRGSNRAFTCTTGGNVENLPASIDYVMRGEIVRWNGEEWVISSFRGTVTIKSSTTCGFSTPMTRDSIRGRLIDA